MRKIIIKTLIFTVICLATPLFNFAQNKQSNTVPDITLTDLQGKTVRIQNFKGKVVLVNFWALWCIPCLAEIPELVKWQKEYEKQGLQIMGITYPPTNRSKVRRFARQNKINYPILFGSKKTKSLFDSGETMPFTIIIDKEGLIRESIEGVIFADEFDEKVKPLLQPYSIKKPGVNRRLSSNNGDNRSADN